MRLKAVSNSPGLVLSIISGKDSGLRHDPRFTDTADFMLAVNDMHVNLGILSDSKNPVVAKI